MNEAVCDQCDWQTRLKMPFSAWPRVLTWMQILKGSKDILDKIRFCMKCKIT